MVRAEESGKACVFHETGNLLPAHPRQSILTFDHDGDFEHKTSTLESGSSSHSQGVLQNTPASWLTPYLSNQFRQREPLSLFLWMLHPDQLALLDQAGDRPHSQFFLPPEQFVHIPFLRRADRLEIEFCQFHTRLPFTDEARLFLQLG